MLVRRRNRAAADAGRWRGLPLPGVFEEDGGTSRLRMMPLVPRMLRSA